MNVKLNGINCLVKKPLEIRISDQKDGLSSGVAIMDVTPQYMQQFDLGSITFRNNYTAYLTVKVKCKPASEKDETRWRTCVDHMRLMPDPHTDTSSQDYVTISRPMMLFEPTDVTAVRLVLLQPSPVWAHFGIEDVTIFPPDSQESESSMSVTAWLLESQHLTDTNPSQMPRTQSEDMPAVDRITAGLQHLWALTENMRSNQTQTSLGRYDVDGSYEINLLSYT